MMEKEIFSWNFHRHFIPALQAFILGGFGSGMEILILVFLGFRSIPYAYGVPAGVVFGKMTAEEI